MFYEYAEKEWKRGNISVGLSADESDKKVYIDAKGLAQFLLPFLSDIEKLKLAKLSKENVKHHVMCPYKR
jgi:hypothetical protein